MAQSLVRYRTNDYSVPVAYGHQDVWVRGYVDEVVIGCRGDIIVRHPRSSDLEVADGGMAQAAYLEAISPETTAERRRAIGTALRACCARDTEAMIVLARQLVAPDT